MEVGILLVEAADGIRDVERYRGLGDVYKSLGSLATVHGYVSHYRSL